MTDLLTAFQAAKVVEGFQQQRRFLLITTKAKKPDFTGSEMAVYQDLLKPINECLIAVNDIKDSNRGSDVFSQLSAVSDGIMVLAWVTVDNRPYKHVEESLGSVQFFGNRVLKENKEKSVCLSESLTVTVLLLTWSLQRPQTGRMGAVPLPNLPRPRRLR